MQVWYESDNPNGFVTGKRFSIDKPCVAIMAAGMGGDSLGHWHLQFDKKGYMNKPLPSSKPLYRVPLVSETALLSWNGFKVVSTFSGTGGSCYGYKLAGFKIVWANEFVPIAQQCYRANFSDTYLDPRDIKLVQPSDILATTGLNEGELDLFDGSPPCQAFSTAGKRAKGWGKGKKYEHGVIQNNEDLFFEYIRLLRGLKPKIFIAENVSGLLKGVCKGYFLNILAELKASGYMVECRLLDAQWLGVPQQRQRAIFIGVRNDITTLDIRPAFPSPLPYRYSVREAIPWIDGQGQETGGAWKYPDRSDMPSYAVHAQGIGQFIARVIHDTTGKGGTEGINGYSAGDITDRPAPTITNGINGLNSRHFTVSEVPKVGLVKDFHEAGGLSKTECADFSDLIIQRRKFTIAEVKRICSFPDDFILCGSYAQQWERLGNSVPPIMMFYIASTVRDKILIPLKNHTSTHAQTS